MFENTGEGCIAHADETEALKDVTINKRELKKKLFVLVKKVCTYFCNIFWEHTVLAACLSRTHGGASLLASPISRNFWSIVKRRSKII
jgi:hypothetical protein